MNVPRKNAEALPNPGLQGAEPGLPADAHVRGWRFDSFELDLRRGELHRQGGAAIPLRPKAEALLRLLLSEPGRLFSRDELIASVWPATVVTDDSLVQCVGELRAALGDRSQHLIRTVPRRGYRLEAVVAPMCDPPESQPPYPLDEAKPIAASTSAANEGHARIAARWSRSQWLVLAVLLVAASAMVLVALRPSPARVNIDETIAARSTVAVMPFVAEAGPPVLREVADTSAEAITAQLSTRVGMRGIGRASTAAYDGSAPPLAQIAKALKATHVVTGRVGAAAGGERMVMDVQLVAVGNGEVIWARHYEAPTADKGALSADVGHHVANAVRNRGNKGGGPRPSLPDEQQGPADLAILGWRDLDRPKSLDDVFRARKRFLMASAADPESLIALHGLAATYFAERSDPGRRVGAEQIAEHERVVERSRRLAPDDATSLMHWGRFQLLRGRADLALPAFERAARIVPSYPDNFVLMAQSRLMLGQTDQIQALTERAIALGAGDPRRVSQAYAVAAEAALMRGDDARAYDLAGRSLAVQPFNVQAQGTLAAIDALAGRDRQAADAMAAFRKLWPTATVSRYDELRPSTDPAYREQRARLYEGLRKAGLPEQ